ncbi:hypothetical protein H257_12335 [Aphanomyces astaci]|uniref:Chromo domain-containing protein n=1 Tax=Aphanomyces astaci TaxID=112090 RepID=W4G0M9_APHAT|nr:hypothetical protein H257_12335 [Aphanomyces astaci]ETV72569.1 hypothetical protein H257_12335 [Aphanomyces astaci]|eukprot:XP_009837797.1 hypothetical protein H257_12335 [Aphanomyces astaci]
MLKVKSIAGHNFVPDVKDFMLEVLWEGFEDIESSWEPLHKLVHECPAMVKNYVEVKKTASEGEELARPKWSSTEATGCRPLANRHEKA